MIDRQQEQGKQEDELKKQEIEGMFAERARVHIIVSGKVQGVFFRDYTKKEADKLGLTGWVKNTDNGVEIIAEGDKNKLRKLIIAAKKGSPLSKVENVDYDYSSYTGKFDDFFINY